MNDNEITKLRVLENSSIELSENENEVKPKAERKISHPNQTNPIFKKLAQFNNAKIGEKLSVKDLLR